MTLREKHKKQTKSLICCEKKHEPIKNIILWILFKFIFNIYVTFFDGSTRFAF